MKKIICIILGIFLIFVVFGTKKSVWASDPHLFLNPTSGSKSANFEVEVKIDTGGKAAAGVDVHLEYPKNLLKIDGVIKGGTGADKTPAFSELYSQIKNDEGKLRINAYFSTSQAGNSFTGNNGLVATITFSPLASGTAAVNFICNPPPATDESNIIDKITVQDIIVCTSNVNGSYTLTTSSGTQATSTPTPGTGATTSPATPTPPTPGSLTQTIGLIGIGILTLLTGMALAL